MTIWIAVIGVVAALLGLGALTGWIWANTKGGQGVKSQLARVEIGLSVFFAMVAIMVAVDLIIVAVKLNAYVQETLPRDAAQEQCQSATITVLRSWVQARIRRDDTMDARDDAVITLLDKLDSGQQPSSDEITHWQNAVLADRAERKEATIELQDIPKCEP